MPSVEQGVVPAYVRGDQYSHGPDDDDRPTGLSIDVGEYADPDTAVFSAGHGTLAALDACGARGW